MRAVIQRVNEASVTINDKIVGKIGKGILIFVGIGKGDDESDIKYIKDKSLGLRIFEDENQRMTFNVCDIGGEVLLISQFTLYGNCTKGRRPNFEDAMPPKEARPMYDQLVKAFKEGPVNIQTGRFGADMVVSLVNDGPVTINLDSTKLF